MLKEVILIGYFYETVELCRRAGYDIRGYIDSEKNQDTDLDYLGNDETIISNPQEYIDTPIFIVPDTPKLRALLYKKYKEAGFSFATIISPLATVSESAVVEEGCMVQDGCNISSSVHLGKCVRVNSCANIMHDSHVCAFSVVAPSSVILGRCEVGVASYIGANATLLPNIKVGDNATVGAGAVVTKNVDNSIVVIGVPAKKLKSISL